jgi:hypothetical protein
MVEATLRRTARFETTRLPATIFRAALVAAAVIVTARIVAARFAALRRSIFGRRQVAAAYVWALRASTALATSTAAPATATATVTTTIATAIILAAAIAATAGAWRVILSGIVMGRKILRRRGVRIRLALLGVMSIVVHFGGVGAESFVSSGLVIHGAGLLVVREGIMLRRFVPRGLAVKGFVRGFLAVSFVHMLFFMLMQGGGMGECFAGKQFDNVRRDG